MKIADIKTYLVGNPWKNWLFVQVHTDEGIIGTGEGSLGHLSKTVETAVHEMKPLIMGLDIFQTELLVGKLSRQVYADGGQIKMCAISALEIACWDAIGKALNQPIYNLVGGRCHERIPAYINGWYRCERTPAAFHKAAKFVSEKGFFAMKFDPFGSSIGRMTPQDEDLAIDLVAAVRDATGPNALLAIEAHSRFTPSTAIRIAKRVNRVMGRRGKVLEERYHEHILKTPTEVRNARVYLSTNANRHLGVEGDDPYASKRPLVQPETFLMRRFSMRETR